MGIWYCTEDDVVTAVDFQASTLDLAAVGRAIDDASRLIEGQCHRVFYPWTGTRYFPWPAQELGTSWRLWLDRDEVLSVTALVSGDVTIGSGSYFLEPVNPGPPYRSIEINLAGPGVFNSGSTFQRNIAVTGVFAGAAIDEAPAGMLAGAMSDTTGTTATVSDGSKVSVGSLIRVGAERMTVTARAWTDTGQTGTLGGSAADVTLTVASGAAVHAGEMLLLGSERMLAVDVAGNNVTVRRAQAGTVLASHTTATVYAQRTLTVTRGVLGTTAATHADASAVWAHQFPVRTWATAEAVNTVLQESSGYARIVGSGEGTVKAPGGGLEDLRERSLARWARRRARTGVV